MEIINFCKECGGKIITDNQFNFVICQNCYDIKFYNKQLNKQLDELIKIKEQIKTTIKQILELKPLQTI